MDHFDKNRKYFRQMSWYLNNNGIKMMLCSPFYGFKTNFQKQTNDNGRYRIAKLALLSFAHLKKKITQ